MSPGSTAIRSLEELALQDSWLHRRDPRAKLICTVMYLVAVVSAGPMSLVPVIALMGLPLFVTVSANVPPGPIVLRVLAAMPFVLAVSIWTPFVAPENAAGYLPWIPVLVVFLKTVQCIWMVVLLAATTPIPELAVGAGRIGFPAVLVNAVQFVYRFMILMMREAGRMLRARRIRAAGGQALSFRSAISMLATLLVRSGERSVRVSRSMFSRGYGGRIYLFRELRFSMWDGWTMVLCFAAVLTGRFGPLLINRWEDLLP